MISDAPPDRAVSGQGFLQIALNMDDPEDAAKKFDALAVGGTVSQPLADSFWGAKFGMLTDAFGIRWMFNCALNKV